MTALKTAGLVALMILVLLDLFAGSPITATVLFFTCCLPLARHIGHEMGTRNAERTIARIHTEVWGTK